VELVEANPRTTRSRSKQKPDASIARYAVATTFYSRIAISDESRAS
jgi:hypothetical protein